MILTKEQILNSKDISNITIEIPEWGGSVIIGMMSGFARDRFEASIVGKSGGMNTQNIRAKLAAATIVDEKNNLLFSEDEIVKLGNKSSAALDRVFAAAQKLNKIGDADIESLAKN